MKQHKMKHIKGFMKPYNSHAVTGATSARINKAANYSSLQHLIKNHKRENGVIEINTVVIASREPDNDIRDLIGSLYDFLKEDGIPELVLQGELMMTLETDEIQPIMIKVIITEDKIIHQETTLNWVDHKSYQI